MSMDDSRDKLICVLRANSAASLLRMTSFVLMAVRMVALLVPFDPIGVVILVFLDFIIADFLSFPIAAFPKADFSGRDDGSEWDFAI